jgi:transcriptional regulator with XRE-family HTH domain
MGTFNHRRLREWRLASDLTPEQVCVRAEVSYPHYRAVEDGTRGPSVALLERLAAVFGRSAGELFTGSDAERAGAL